jgi:hypothetical protein
VNLAALGALVAGVVAGTLSGMFGIGGGIVLVPMMGLLLGLDQHQAQGISLGVMLLPIGLPAVLQYRRAGVRVRWRLVLILLAGFLAGVTGGSLAANHIPAAPLRWTFVTFLLAMALRYHLASRRQGPLPGRKEAAGLAFVLLGLLIGAFGGTLSGLLGIGGGAVIIPFLAIWLGMDQHEAQVTSLTLMLPPIGLPGVLIYAKGHGLPWVPLLMAAAGFAGGAFLGARSATSMRGPSLQRFFALLLVLLAVLMASKV